MKHNEATIFIFIASIILGVLISSNMNLGKFNNKVLLNPAEYQKAYNYNMKLDRDIRNLKDEYKEYSKKLKKYKEDEYNENKEKLRNEMKNEILTNEMILGNEDVEGEGIIVILGDALQKLKDPQITPMERMSLMVHDRDILGVINDLRYAGAEAISINGQRVTNKSYILCGGVFALIDGIKIPGPFHIKAIGDKEKLYSYIEGNEASVSILKIRGVDITVTKEDNMKIIENDKKLHYNYMKDSKSNNK
ncbi:division initiation protein [Clostridium novyi A str. 4552]|uniref:Division initiation protein n=1 Tax=Clostridium novyi A str. 4552 TaxID=1444289 RepID=A0A0A0IAN2_CLONO|nr:DUF881 domain-containing protein [Clostridium novyi]KGM97371.1 division initiation protein [Clostridium novyi A str. 4552]